MTWPSDAPQPIPYDKGKHHRYGDNPKFWNWEFDPKTFVDLVRQAVDKVIENIDFQQAIERMTLSKFKTEL